METVQPFYAFELRDAEIRFNNRNDRIEARIKLASDVVVKIYLEDRSEYARLLSRGIDDEIRT